MSNIPFLSKRDRRRGENSVDVNNPLQTVLKHLKLYMLTQIVWQISYYIAEKGFTQYLYPNKQNSVDFMNGLAMATCNVKGLEEVEKVR